jgi:hypothetical protein
MATKTPSKHGSFLGRPSKYKPEYAQQIRELGKLGYSHAQMAAHLGVLVINLRGWAESFPEFRVAFDLAVQDSLAYWETTAHQHMIETPGGPKINTGLWSRSMAARFPREYSDRSKVEVTGNAGGPVQVDVVHDFAQSLMDELLIARQRDAESSSSK